MVTPGLSSVLTPLASAAWVSFSCKALFIASLARAMTWPADRGADVDSIEPELLLAEVLNWSGIGGGGGRGNAVVGGPRLIPGGRLVGRFLEVD